MTLDAPRRIARQSLLALLLFVASLAVLAGETIPGAAWRHAASPAAAGWSSAGLKAADGYARSLDTEAYLVVEGGVIVHEYGATSHATNVHSVKSVLSLLIGMYVDRGAIDLRRTLAELGIDDRGGLSEAERRATVEELLQARSGVYHPAAYETQAMAQRRPARGSFAPGTHFYYNNWDFNALGTIFGRLAGKTVFEALRDDLAAPLQFEDFDAAADTRFHSESASEHPAYLMRLSARDLARIGLLVARQGRWGGRELVSERWIAQSTTPYSNDARPGVGYGYLWWVGLRGMHFGVRFPGTVVSARGHRGQYVVVDPVRDIVVVHKVDSEARSGRNVSGAQFGRLLKLILDARS